MSAPPHPQEHHLAVRRTARYYSLGDATARELWFVVHGYSQLAGRFIRRFRDIDDARRLVVAPEALNRYYFESAPGAHAADAGVGATWMTREDRLVEIGDYVAYLDTLHRHVAGALAAPPERIVALGFSQGAATVARWAAQGAARIDHVVLWAGYLPPELEPAPGLFRGARLTWMLGRDDPYTPASKVGAISAQLHAAGLAHELRFYDGGHRVEPAALRALAAALRLT
ncbi:MAG TPA: dienelactone hydrolase family protein [Longimicrobiales bacterium]|nr:dienelactone hydrolase family protein [Longimicrobiales bacterium]